MKKKIGIIGGGQLGMMLTEAAALLDFEITIVDKADCSASFVGAKVLVGAITDPEKIKELAKDADFLTFEIEHINTDALEELENESVTIHPSPHTLKTIKDKFAQKEFLRKNNLPTASFVAIEKDTDITKAGHRFGYPFLLKTRSGGYDGRGNAVVKNEEDIKQAVKKLGDNALYAEKFVPFTKELAVMVARSTNGDIKTYPVVETIHEENILRFTLAPAKIDKKIYQKAENLAKAVMEHLHGAGVFGIEMFLTKNGKVVINEIAPRVHNSGHYTIEACETSQFTQHLLAITGQPLRKTDMIVPAAVMINILGSRIGKANLQGTESAETLGKTYVHWYHKQDVKPLRKMGHITVVGDNLGECLKKTKEARRLISI